jgi:flagellin-like protein
MITWSTWEACPLNGIKSWKLAAGLDGIRTVYLEAKDNAGNIRRVSDTIFLDTTPANITIVPSGTAGWTKDTFIEITVGCDDGGGVGCAGLYYRFYNYNKSDETYHYNWNTYYPPAPGVFVDLIKPIVTSSFKTSVTCSEGRTCKTRLNASSLDKQDQIGVAESKDFMMDLEKPQITLTCKYKSTKLLDRVLGTSMKDCPASTESFSIPAESEVTVEATGDKDALVGSPIAGVVIHFANGSVDSEMQIFTAYSGKIGTNTTSLRKPGTYYYWAYVEDEVQNNKTTDKYSFNVGCNADLTCSAQKGTICKENQRCITESCNEAKDVIKGFTTCCLSADCVNETTLAKCKDMKGKIYNPEIEECSEQSVPASDTSGKNKCCRGRIDTKTPSSVGWYDMLGNKIIGAVKGDKVKCIGISDTTQAGVYFKLNITLNNKLLKQNTSLVNITKKAETDSIILSETGMYKCDGTYSATQSTQTVSLVVNDNPTKPNYTELPGFGLFGFIFSIIGIALFYFINIPKNRKGVSPLIATILLTALTISMFLGVFAWSKSFIKEQTEKLGGPIETACQQVIFDATLSGGYASITNKGNVVIYGFNAKAETGGTTKTKFMKTESGKVGGGEVDKLDVSEYSTATHITLIPVLAGKGTKTGTGKLYVCTEKAKAIK